MDNGDEDVPRMMWSKNLRRTVPIRGWYIHSTPHIPSCNAARTTKSSRHFPVAELGCAPQVSPDRRLNCREVPPTRPTVTNWNFREPAVIGDAYGTSDILHVALGVGEAIPRTVQVELRRNAVSP